jgi:hypothetical protein
MKNPTTHRPLSATNLLSYCGILPCMYLDMPIWILWRFRVLMSCLLLPNSQKKHVIPSPFQQPILLCCLGILPCMYVDMPIWRNLLCCCRILPCMCPLKGSEFSCHVCCCPIHKKRHVIDTSGCIAAMWQKKKKEKKKTCSCWLIELD